MAATRLKSLLSEWSKGKVEAPVCAIVRPETTSSRVIDVEKARYHASNVHNGEWNRGLTMIALDSDDTITSAHKDAMPGEWGKRYDTMVSTLACETDVWDQSTFLIAVDAQHRTLGVEMALVWNKEADPTQDHYYVYTWVIVLKKDTPAVVVVRHSYTQPNPTKPNPTQPSWTDHNPTLLKCEVGPNRGKARLVRV
jgi:hypothetical protein